MRKIVQIAAIPEAPNDVGECLYAVCDDGTVWAFRSQLASEIRYEKKWRRLPDVPQGDDG